MASLLSEGMQSASGAKPLGPGDEGDEVKALQKKLTEAGYPVKETGVYDEATVKAVKALQRDNGLPESGVADAETMALLGGVKKPQDDAALMYGGGGQ